MEVRQAGETLENSEDEWTTRNAECGDRKNQKAKRNPEFKSSHSPLLLCELKNVSPLSQETNSPRQKIALINIQIYNIYDMNGTPLDIVSLRSVQPKQP